MIAGLYDTSWTTDAVRSQAAVLNRMCGLKDSDDLSLCGTARSISPDASSRLEVVNDAWGPGDVARSMPMQTGEEVYSGS